MKTIESAGGPYLIISDHFRDTWGAYLHKSFSSPDMPFPDDYAAAGALTCGVLNPPCNIAKLVGKEAEALLISMPFEIAIVDAVNSSVFLAQVEYAEPEWSFSEISLDEFVMGDFSEQITFSSKASTYWLFDAAYLPTAVGEDCLKFDLPNGDYVLSCSYKADEVKGVFLYRIDPANRI